MKIHHTVLAIFATAITVWAQDPPARVARLSLLEGPVSFQPAGVSDWAGATLNYPLTTGDYLYSDQGARAEIRLGPNAIRLSGQTNVGFLNLDDRTVQIRLTEGSVNIRVRELGDQEIWEVDTPNGAISLLRAGEYRIDTDPNRNATMVTVRGGEAEVTANGQSFPVRIRQTAYFAGDGRQESIQEANAEDDFDRFALDRDRREDRIPPPRYVSRQMVGYEDLDQYGSWEPSEEYGPVWRPRARAGWSPYRDGRWTYREPWGWTWVDDAPWGFAPFHYGRWAYYRGGWGWCPGPAVVARPVYAPALVAFVGGGGLNVSLNIGGGVGWFPLGPREIYTPSYRVSPRYVREVNYFGGTNVVVNRQVTNVYVNRNAPGGFQAMSRQDFVASRPVQRSGFQGSFEQFRSGPVSGFAPGFAPQRESLFGRERGGSFARPRDAVFHREVIARTAPPAAPVPFEMRQQAIRENGGRPLAPEQLNELRGRGTIRQPAVRSAISPGQGFGRNAGADGGADNRGFGRQQDRGVPASPQPVPQPGVAPESRGFGRQQDRVAPAPQQQNTPQPGVAPENRSFGRQQDRVAPAPQQQNTPQPGVAPENRGFGRQQDRVAPAPQQQNTPQPGVAPENRSFGRQQDRVAPAPQQQNTPQPGVAPENRGFGRQQDRAMPAPQEQPAPRSNVAPENRGFGRERGNPEPRPDAPRQETPRENRGFGRPAAQQEASPPAAPAENRGFGRQSQPRAETPAPAQPPAPRSEPPAQENRGFGRSQRSENQAERRADRPKDEKKDDKPKEERRFR